MNSEVIIKIAKCQESSVNEVGGTKTQ